MSDPNDHQVLTDAELRVLDLRHQHQHGVEHLQLGLAELAAAGAMHLAPPLDELKDMKDHRGNPVRVPMDAVVLPKGEQGHNCHCHGKDHNCKIVLRICHQPEHVWCIKYLIEFFHQWQAAQQDAINAGVGGDSSFTGLLGPSSMLGGSSQQRSVIPFCPLCREICHCQKPCPDPPCTVCCSRPKNKTRKKDYRKRKAEQAMADAHAAKHAAVADPHGLAAQAMAGLWAHMPGSSAQQLQQLTNMGLVLPPHLLPQHQQVLQANGMLMGPGGAVVGGAPASPQSLEEYQQRAAAAAGVPWLQMQPPQQSDSPGGGAGKQQQQHPGSGFTNVSMGTLLQAMMPGYSGMLHIREDGQLMLIDPTADPSGAAQLAAQQQLQLMDPAGLAGGAVGLGAGDMAGLGGMMEGPPGSPSQQQLGHDGLPLQQQQLLAAASSGQYGAGVNNVLQSLYGGGWSWPNSAGGQPQQQQQQLSMAQGDAGGQSPGQSDYKKEPGKL